MAEILHHSDLDWQERALHYGDGLFETLLKRAGEIPLWPAHYARLENGCERLSIVVPEAEWLRQQVIEKSADFEHAVIKIIVSRGRGGRGLELPPAASNSVFVFCYPGPAASLKAHRVKICTTRLPLNPNLAGLKHLNRLDYVLAALELEAAPALTEGILLDSDGFLVEGLISNLFFFDGVTLMTPSLEYCGVNGIVRQWIVDYFDNNRIPCRQGRYTPEELFSATECFMCNSVRGITPIEVIDGRAFEPGPLTREITAALDKLMKA